MSSVTKLFLAASSFGYRDPVSLFPIPLILVATKFSVATWVFPRVSSFYGILVAT